MKKFILIFVIIAQLSIPAYMVYRYENTLKNGDLFRFRVYPIDPYDPFRGRYVHLNFNSVNVAYNGKEEITYGDFVYVSIEKEASGETKFIEAFKQKPSTGNYLKMASRTFNQSSSSLDVRFILDRYYSRETKALAIETVVREYSRNSLDDEGAIATVRIKNGLGVIEELYVGELTIHEFLAQQQEKE